MELIVERVAELPRHLSALSPNAAAAVEAYRVAFELNELVYTAGDSIFDSTHAASIERWEGVAGRQSATAAVSYRGPHVTCLHAWHSCSKPDRPVQPWNEPNGPDCRLVVAAAEGLCKLAAAVESGMAQRPGLPGGWHLPQVDAGCTALAACCRLAQGLKQLPAGAAFKLGAACSLVFGPGRTFLDKALSAAVADPSTEAITNLEVTVSTQLAAIEYVVVELLQSSRQPQAAAAFAGSTAKPASILPWLTSLINAVPLALGSVRPGKLRGGSHTLVVLQLAVEPMRGAFA